MILLQRSLKIENIQISIKLKKKIISKNENSSNICETKRIVQPTNLFLLQRSGKVIYRNQY